MRFYKSERFRVSLTPSKDATGAAPAVAGAKRKREEQSMPPPGPRITFKQSKSSLDIHQNINNIPPTPTLVAAPPPPPSPVSTPQPEQPRKLTKLRIPNFIAMPPPAPVTQSPSTTPSTPGGFKLKLKFGAPKSSIQ